MLAFSKCLRQSSETAVRTTVRKCMNVKASLQHEQHPLLSSANRQRCIEKLRQAKPYGRPSALRERIKREQTYASVLIPLCNERGSNELSLLYTRRSAKLRRHSHQISFPGGLRDETDPDYVACALRETEEEIGLAPARVQIWGQGELMHLPHTAAIMPVVGFIPDLESAELQLNADEVDEVVALPIARLVTPASARHTQFKTGYSGPAFVVDHYRVWGITGYLTHLFLRCLLPANECQVLINNIKFVPPYKRRPPPSG